MPFWKKKERTYEEVETEEPTVEKRIAVRVFKPQKSDDIRPILEAFRKGKTVALINLTELSDKDYGEPQLTIKKLKQIAKDTGGDIAAVKDNWIVLAPESAEIYRKKKTDVKEIIEGEN